MRIRDHVFIVTGGASGLGAAACSHLAQQGGRVVVADMDDAKGQAFAKSLGTSARFVHCDVTLEADGTRTIEAAALLGELRGLINCAGVAPAEKTLGQSGPHRLETFVHALQINLIGSFNMLRLAAQAMSLLAPLEHGERGVIINTASVAAFEGQIGQAAYAASKGGITAMTLPIARDLARFGIRCMCIAPGIFATPLLLGMPAEVQMALGQQVPFPTRLGEPDEFAALVQTIIENAYLNGTTVRLDGALRMPPK